MRSRSLRRFSLLTIVVGFLILLAGCDKKSVVAGGGAFIAGWLLGGLGSTNTVTTCYSNAVLVDCSTLPPGIVQ